VTLKTISNKEFYKSLSNNFTFEKNPHIGLCVSGGVDSMALMILMNHWIKKHKGKLTIFHFNHNLRKESKKEAQFVSKEIKKIGLEFHILEWTGVKEKSGVMEKAREARYGAIIKLCEKLGIIHLMTAHHLNDNIETFFMRLKRKNSTLGLSSIPEKKILKNLQILRPLINYKKKRLIDTCLFHKLRWLEDPSNENKIFERSRIRDELSKKNLYENKKLKNQFKDRQINNSNIEKKISDFFAEKLRFFEYGVFELSIKNLFEQRNYIKIEILKKILTTCSGNFYSPAKEAVEDLISKIRDGRETKYTLHSCLILISNQRLRFYREILNKKNVEKFFSLKRGMSSLWDNRFQITSNLYTAKCEVINEKKWMNLKKYFSLEKSKINFFILQSLPLIKINKTNIIPFVSNDSVFKKNKLDFYFNPKIPLTKKNFFRY